MTFLETQSSQEPSSKKEAISECPDPVWLGCSRKGGVGTQTQGECCVMKAAESLSVTQGWQWGTAGHWELGEARNSIPHSPREGPAQLTPRSLARSLLSCIHLCCLTNYGNDPRKVQPLNLCGLRRHSGHLSPSEFLWAPTHLLIFPDKKTLLLILFIYFFNEITSSYILGNKTLAKGYNISCILPFICNIILQFLLWK